MRSKVLSVYKLLHRTSQKTFQNDDVALQAARLRIHSEFNKNKDVTKQEEIEKLIKIAKDVEKLMKTSVAQGVLNEQGRYELHIHEHLLREDNVPLHTRDNEDKR